MRRSHRRNDQYPFNSITCCALASWPGGPGMWPHLPEYVSAPSCLHCVSRIFRGQIVSILDLVDTAKHCLVDFHASLFVIHFRVCRRIVHYNQFSIIWWMRNTFWETIWKGLMASDENRRLLSEFKIIERTSRCAIAIVLFENLFKHFLVVQNFLIFLNNIYRSSELFDFLLQKSIISPRLCMRCPNFRE